MNFHILLTEDVESLIESGDWDSHYTTNDSQKSDDGAYIWVVGNHSNIALQSFETSAEMFAYCYANGWTKPDDDI